MTNKISVHQTVLLNEAIDGLNLHSRSQKKLTVVDATFGGGGHSAEICKRSLKLNLGIKVIAIDQDEGAFKKVKSKFEGLDCDISFININFRHLGVGHLSTPIDAIIFDLGLSSDQLENSGRGFSFIKDETLLMTMKEKLLPEDTTAKEIVNNWGEKSLADIIYGYGEERFAKRIAHGIVEARLKGKIETTFDLVKIIGDSVPNVYKRGKIHYATRTFQALRIAVNDELNSLSDGLNKSFEILRSGGRISVISFHSLEDRIVKKFFKQKEKEGKAKLLNKKPIIPTLEEIRKNNRSRSAKLRILEKI